MDIYKVAGLYIANLRAIYLIHQNNHWLSSGDSFYSNHLLFERIYKSAQDNADAAAEKFIGLFGAECADYSDQTKYINLILKKYSSLQDSPFEQSYAAEKDFLKMSEKVYKFLKEKNKVSFGLDDTIMSISSDRESAIYLLDRVLS